MTPYEPYLCALECNMPAGLIVAASAVRNTVGTSGAKFDGVHGDNARVAMHELPPSLPPPFLPANYGAGLTAGNADQSSTILIAVIAACASLFILFVVCCRRIRFS